MVAFGSWFWAESVIGSSQCAGPGSPVIAGVCFPLPNPATLHVAQVRRLVANGRGILRDQGFSASESGLYDILRARPRGAYPVGQAPKDGIKPA